MWMKRAEYVRLCERLARLEAAQEARNAQAQRQAEDARRLAEQFENLLAYDGTAQTGGDKDGMG